MLSNMILTVSPPPASRNLRLADRFLPPTLGGRKFHSANPPMTLQLDDTKVNETSTIFIFLGLKETKTTRCFNTFLVAMDWLLSAGVAALLYLREPLEPLLCSQQFLQAPLPA